ncbi:MAG TPA: protein-glutamine glutaminase family protein [Stellaceae bacterium]|nr:protein-glutamine glutaminase family protein [Stellaceae bacterium]
MAAARETSVLTVAAIRTGKDKSTEYLFNERQRIFTLAPRGAADEQSARFLKEALGRKRPVKAALDLRRAVIHRVAEPTKPELDEFARNRVPLEKPDKVVPIEVSEIDPTTFNFVDLYLKWPSFRLCHKLVPSYAKAKQIFDFCAQLSCDLPGPYAVPPCIPFQYVRDGCYARAHQMRRIITTRYDYCCEKVFSFANQQHDTLAVKADKWGGCCVTWWYHVAPLIRVRLRLRGVPRPGLVLAMVIDPGMFNKPVLLSTWLAAQENNTCSSTARVSAYSIQPGSAYWPTNYAGTSFGTDPNYTQTESTLIAYSGLKTCP